MLVLEQEYLTSKEIASELKVDHETILRWLRQRHLVGYKFGQQWRIRRDDYEKFVRERRNIIEQEQA